MQRFRTHVQSALAHAVGFTTVLVVLVQHRFEAQRKDRERATAVEYGLLVGLIAIVIIVAVSALGGRLQAIFATLANSSAVEPGVQPEVGATPEIALPRGLAVPGRRSDQRGERGAAAVEFALVVPVLLLLVLGIAEFGRAYNIQTVISGAAREGVRTMAVENDTGAARAATRAAAPTLELNDDQIDVSPSACPVDDTSPTVSATVTVTYRMSFVTDLFADSLIVTGVGVMRCNG